MRQVWNRLCRLATPPDTPVRLAPAKHASACVLHSAACQARQLFRVAAAHATRRQFPGSGHDASLFTFLNSQETRDEMEQAAIPGSALRLRDHDVHLEPLKSP